MAFAGMFIIFFIILLIIAGTMLLMSLILLIVGIVRHRRKKSGKVFFIISGVLAALVVTPILMFALPVKVDIDTPDGRGYVWSNGRDMLYSAIYRGDTDAVDKLLDKNPKLVYVIKYGDNMDGLHTAMMKNDIDTAKCIIEHGGAFDSGYNFAENEYTYSLECYFNTYYIRTKLDDLKYSEYECVKFMIDNNAKAEFAEDRSNALFYAVDSICYDCIISDEEAEMIGLLIDAGADIADKNAYGKTPCDVFLERVEIDKITDDDKNKIVPLLENR